MPFHWRSPPLRADTFQTTPFYRAAIGAAVPLVPIVDRSDRARTAHRQRIAAPAAMREWARRERDPSRPLAWFHAPSVGEGMQARAVIEEFTRAHPDVQVAFTHFSPSAAAFAARMPADYRGYLPYDRRRDVHEALDALRPDVLVFTKLDLWPELAIQAHARGTAVSMVAGTVLADSGRLRWPARGQLRPGYAVLDAVGAVSEEDAARIHALGARESSIEVTGDPRIDSVIAVAAAVEVDDPLTVLTNPRETLVAGSTWPADESVVLEAFGRVRATHGEATLIIVPHEPSDVHLRRLEGGIEKLGLSSVRLSAITSARVAAVVIVDRIGILARLYVNGEIAYVGGGWGTAGIHSVLEPAALQRFVIIGPHDRGSRDARLLAAAGGLLRLPEAAPAEALASEWTRLLGSDVERASAGRCARSALDAERGAARRSVAVIERALSRGKQTPSA